MVSAVCYCLYDAGLDNNDESDNIARCIEYFQVYIKDGAYGCNCIRICRFICDVCSRWGRQFTLYNYVFLFKEAV